MSNKQKIAQFSPNPETRRQELENNIVSVCVKCPHAKFVTGHFECQVARRHCHSNRVIKWLKELETLANVNNIPPLNNPPPKRRKEGEEEGEGEVELEQ